jgi:DNA-binding GntR family transcriptional regulator
VKRGKRGIIMINKFNNIPLYLQLKTIILDRITSGEYPENSQIPSEQAFCETYNISRPTVRQAISDLTNSGYLRKEKGKGTFVYGYENYSFIRNYSGMKVSILDSNDYFTDRTIISAKTIKYNDAPGNVQKYFSDTTRQEFAEITYKPTKSPDSKVSYSISYISTVSFHDILTDINNNKPLFEIFTGKYPLIPEKCISNMEVCFANEKDGYYLELQNGIPMFKIENVLFSKTGIVVEFIITKYRADKTSFIFEYQK